jgi:hypothetical protein
MGQRGWRGSRRCRIGFFVAAALSASLVAAPSGVGAQAAGLGTPRPFSTSVGAPTGSGRIDPGEPCSEGGDGGYWHYDYESTLPAGVITGLQSTLPGTARLHLDLHSEDHIVRATPGEPQAGRAWLEGTESEVTLANQRGTVTMQLRSLADEVGAGCETARNLTFDGATATGAGLQWEIARSTGSYRQAEGDGTATLRAAVTPGPDNPFQLDLGGDVAVLQPNLKLEFVDSYWAFLGAHYAVRRVTVIYRVTNTGPGDAFGVRLVGASSPTQGAKLVGPLPFNTATTNQGPVPQFLADIPAGQSEIVRLRWQLPIPSGDPPCELVILGCEFDTRLRFDMPDALDVVEATKSALVRVKAPDFPPPVVD